MAPSRYGTSHYGSSQSSYSSGYPPQQSYAEPRSSASGPYGSPYACNSAPSDERRPNPHTTLPPYQPQQSPVQRSQYQPQQPAAPASAASFAHPYNYTSSGSNSYPPQQLYPPTTYGVSEYHPLPTMHPPSSTTPAAYPTYESSQGAPPPPSSGLPALSSSPRTRESAVLPRVVNSRPKPTCWDHGCNGRQFSTFSNLLRHQREKGGTAQKSYCPRCGAEFTRTTARNGHMAHDKCKPRRASEASG